MTIKNPSSRGSLEGCVFRQIMTAYCNFCVLISPDQVTMVFTRSMTGLVKSAIRIV